MKQSSFPLRLDLEVLVGHKWEVMLSYRVTTKSQLFEKMQYIKSMYNLKGRDWRIYFYLNSKVNKPQIKKGVSRNKPHSHQFQNMQKN